MSIQLLNGLSNLLEIAKSSHLQGPPSPEPEYSEGGAIMIFSDGPKALKMIYLYVILGLALYIVIIGLIEAITISIAKPQDSERMTIRFFSCIWPIFIVGILIALVFTLLADLGNIIGRKITKS